MNTLILAAILTAAQAPKPDFIFMHVNVVPMDREHILVGKDVLVKDGKVLDIVDGYTYKAPEGVPTVDGGNTMFLMPGLCDMHVHVYYEDDFTLYLANGVTTIRNMSGKPKHLVWRGRLDRGELFGPRMITAGPILSGKNDNHPGFLNLSTYADGVKEVESQAKAGYDFIKVYDPLPADAFRGAMDAAKRLHLPVAGHVNQDLALDGVLNSGQACIEHCEQLAYHTTFGDYDFSKCSEIAAKVKKAGVTVCPTVGVIHQFVTLHRNKQAVLNMPEWKYASPGVKEWWSGLSRDDSTENEILVTWQRRMVRALADADVPLISGTDTFLFGFVPGFSLHHEFDFLADCGLSNYEVLKSTTSAPGDYLHMKIGRIEKGYLADMVLLPDNPLASLHNLDHIEGVMSRGVWHPKLELQTKLAEVEKANNRAAK
ncbi:MAG: amidohydrolase family protein [Armatimonadetes bacterium]|nr:amidohydrolase family protein [Armatimonadota bacterium]